MADTRLVQADFDQIALLPQGSFDHNSYYHDVLLNVLPPRMHQVLDVGCGTGEFTRLLAGRADRVVALDLSPNMIAVARQQPDAFKNVDFHQADALNWDWPVDRFDSIFFHRHIASLASGRHTSQNEGGVAFGRDVGGAGYPPYIERCGRTVPRRDRIPVQPAAASLSYRPAPSRRKDSSHVERTREE